MSTSVPPFQTLPISFLCLPICLGIVLHRWHPECALPPLFVCSLVLWLLILLFWRKRSYGFVLLYVILFVGLGYMRSTLQALYLDRAIHAQEIAAGEYVARIMRVQKTTSGYLRTHCDNIRSGDDGQKLRGKLIVYDRQEDSTRQYPSVGGEISFELKRINSILPHTPNPKAFDYAYYCWRNGILGTVFSGQVTYRTGDGGFSNFFSNIRGAIIQRLDHVQWSSEERSIIHAMLLGEKGSITQDTRQQMSSTGIAHVLAVSGLHVGIIYTILLALIWCLRLIFSGYHLGWNLIAIPGIWFYAGVCDFGDSVVRAALMLTFYMINRYWLKRRLHSMEVIAASALLLLIYDPLNFWDVGFQLSFAAVAAILLYVPYVSSYVELKVNVKLIKWIILSMAVSIVASLATAPILVYHFHEVSWFSPLGSLIAIPIAYGMFVCGVSVFVPYLGMVAKSIMGFLAHGLLLLGRLSVSGLHTSWSEVWMPLWFLVAMGIVFFLIGWAIFEKSKALFFAAYALGTASIVGTGIIRAWFPYQRAPEIIIYHDYDQVQCDIISGHAVLSVVWKGEYTKHEYIRSIGVANNQIHILRPTGEEKVLRVGDQVMQYYGPGGSFIFPEATMVIVSPQVRFLPFDQLAGMEVVLTPKCVWMLKDNLERYIARSPDCDIRLWDMKEDGPYISTLY